MKATFILDENILEFGLQLPGTGGEDPAKQLIDAIEANCHHIAWDRDVLRLYWRHLETLMAQFPNPVKRFLVTLFNADKFVQVLDVPGLPQDLEGQVKDAPDLPFVRLAAAVDSDAVLATTDGPLRESVHQAGISNHYKFRILPPEDALPFAGPEAS